MAATVAIRELRQNLSRYLRRVEAGESLIVTDRGRGVARLVPLASEPYAELTARLGATTPTGRLEDAAARLRGPRHPAGTTDAYLAEGRGERFHS